VNRKKIIKTILDCEKDPDFLPKIDEMQKSMSQYVNSSAN